MFRPQGLGKVLYMTKGWQFRTIAAAALTALTLMTGKADAAQCGNGPAGFENWKREFAAEARGRVGGVGHRRADDDEL